MPTAKARPRLAAEKPPIKSRYRPEIDGLRAVAIIGVIINHFSKELLPSGFLGVDIFFVISGYVITSSLSRNKSTSLGDFITGFYERRMKRLLPPLLVFVLITSLLICWFSPAPQTSLKTGIASLFGVSNIYLIRNSTDYFAQAAELNPFTHTWFLGAQEQFCVVFLGITWISGFTRRTQNGHRNLLILMALLTPISFAGFAYFYQTNLPIAYFSMPTRFWEIGAGCLLFLRFDSLNLHDQDARGTLPLILLAALAGMMFLPLSAAIPATTFTVLATAMLLACLKPGTTAFAILTDPRVYAIGIISYSLYLWHWGILSISRWTIGIHWQSAPFQILTIAGISALSYKYVETAARKADWFASRWMTLLSGLSVLCMSAFMLFGLLEGGFSKLYLGKRSQKAPPAPGRTITKEQCPNGNQLDDKRLEINCTLKSRNGRTIIAVGDSQTGHLLPMLNKLHADHGFGIKYFTSAGVSFPSLLETRNIGGEGLDTFREKYNRTLDIFAKYIRDASAGDIIFLSSRHELRWGGYPIPLSQRDVRFTFYNQQANPIDRETAFAEWKSRFADIVNVGEKTGADIVIFNSIPTFPDPLPDSIENPQWFNAWSNLKYRKPSRSELLSVYSSVDNHFRDLSLTKSNVHVFDIFSELCPADEALCSAEGYLDQWHLSKAGIQKIYPSMVNFLQVQGLLSDNQG
jgi:peptidoglycan/LPS O-acetylase OafA/YrhL